VGARDKDMQACNHINKVLTNKKILKSRKYYKHSEVALAILMLVNEVGVKENIYNVEISSVISFWSQISPYNNDSAVGGQPGT